MSRLRPIMTCAFAGAMLGGCQATTARDLAVLDAPDSEAIAILKATLAEAMGVASVELGPGDPSQSSTVSVLPPRPGPYEDRSTATPTIFDIVVSGADCFVVKRDTGDTYPLDGVACRAL